MPETEIGVVIASRDRPESLTRCLDGLARQTIGGFLVTVVDDGSAEPVARTLPPRHTDRLDLRILRNERSTGPAAARNRGVDASDTTYIAFIDDDIVPAPDLLERHLDALHLEGDDCVSIGPQSEPADWRSQPWTLWEARRLAVEYRRIEHGDYSPTWRQFHTGNAFSRRERIVDAGGFDERFTRAEDVELALRMHLRGTRFTFTSQAIGWHYSHRSMDGWLAIPRAYARFDVVIDELYPSLHWLRTIHREQGRRHWALRALRSAGTHGGATPTVAGLLTRGAAAMSAIGLSRIAMPTLSLAYDLQYQSALRDALRERERGPLLEDGPLGGVAEPTARQQ